MKKIFDIQLFADEVEETGADLKHTETVEKDKEPDRDERSVPKYSDNDLDRIFSKKFAEMKKKEEKDRTEAERLARMTAEEKANERIRILEEKLAAADRRDALAAMTKEARAMLQEKNINVNDELLGNLISDNADDTKASVENFISLFTAAVENAVKNALKGQTPKTGASTSGYTKEQIMNVTNRAERQRLMKEYAHLF